MRHCATSWLGQARRQKSPEAAVDWRQLSPWLKINSSVTFDILAKQDHQKQNRGAHIDISSNMALDFGAGCAGGTIVLK